MPGCPLFSQVAAAENEACQLPVHVKRADRKAIFSALLQRLASEYDILYADLAKAKSSQAAPSVCARQHDLQKDGVRCLSCSHEVTSGEEEDVLPPVCEVQFDSCATPPPVFELPPPGSDGHQFPTLERTADKSTTQHHKGDSAIIDGDFEAPVEDTEELQHPCNPTNPILQRHAAGGCFSRQGAEHDCRGMKLCMNDQAKAQRVPPRPSESTEKGDRPSSSNGSVCELVSPSGALLETQATAPEKDSDESRKISCTSLDSDSRVPSSSLPTWFTHQNLQESKSAKQKLAKSGARKLGKADENFYTYAHGGYTIMEDYHHCLFNPVSPYRLGWDFLWTVMLLYDLWLLPVLLVFVQDDTIVPDFIDQSIIVTTIFFSIDIVINFFTGYSEGETIIMRQRPAAIHYFKFWFWIDLIATVPFDWLFSRIDYVSFIRVTKTTKATKTFKMLKLFKAVRFMKFFHCMSILEFFRARMSRKLEQGSSLKKMRDLQSLQKWRERLDQLESIKPVLKTAMVLLLLLLHAHVHGSIYGALQPEWARSTAFEEALSKYTISLHWAYNIMTFGFEGRTVDNDSISFLESVMNFERVVLIGYGFYRLIITALIIHEQVSQVTTKTESALKYMARNGLDTTLQLQVVNSLRQCGRLRTVQSRFLDILDKDLPQELRKRVCQEMWGHQLATFGLINCASCWDEQFLSELAQTVHEDVYGPKVMIFKHGDPANDAYLVLEGIVAMQDIQMEIAPFTGGMWIGEKALVSTGLTRSCSGISEVVTRLLVVEGHEFRRLLEKFGLEERYAAYCSDQLWRGVCGRCGSVGDHFADTCPLVDTADATKRAYSRRQKSSDKVVGESRRDLKMFMHYHDLQRIESTLLKLGIESLADLQNADMASLCSKLQTEESVKLTSKEAEKLSLTAIEAFNKVLSSKVLRQLETDRKYDHFMFLSHYKVEAGTEAALMRAELEQIILEEHIATSGQRGAAVFLDSEDLSDLAELQNRVRQSQNVVLLLTNGVLSRPWCLIEVVTAMREGVPVMPVELKKIGSSFKYPNKDFYDCLAKGQMLDEPAMECLAEHAIGMDEVIEVIQRVFHRIALPYSPHRPQNIRRVELQALVKVCREKDRGSAKSEFGGIARTSDTS